MEKVKEKGWLLIILGGLWLIAGSFILIYNGIEAKRASSSFAEAAKACVELADGPALDGQLVHATGMVTTDETLTDRALGMSENLIRLDRKVEYFQIVESTGQEREKDGQGRETVTTIYNYDVAWTDKPVDSKYFYSDKYAGKNFVIKEYPQWSATASDVRLDGRKLPASMVEQAEVNSEISTAGVDIIEIMLSTGRKGVNVSAYDNIIYIGDDPDEPHIGDVRITYTGIEPGTMSVMAALMGDEFVPYKVEGGKEIAWLMDGERSVNDFIAARKKEAGSTEGLGWVLGVLLCIVGTWALLGGIRKRLTPVPVLSVFAEADKLFLCSLGVAAGWSLFCVGLGRLALTPLISLLLMAAGAGLLYGLYVIRNR